METHSNRIPYALWELISLWDASLELEKRLVGLFRRGEDGRRPFNGAVELFQNDPMEGSVAI